MRPRNTELAAMIKLLDREHDSVDDLAREALMLAWSLSEGRDWFGVVIDQPGIGVTLHGPFESKNAAGKFLERFPFAMGRPRVLVARQTTRVGDTLEWSDDA